MDFMKHVESTAKKRGMKVSMVIDPHMPPRAKRILASAGMKRSDPRLDSVELFARGYTTHFPTTLVYAKGKMAERPVIGAYTAEQFDNQLAIQLKKLGAE
jgi:hypothetical protein